MLKFLNKARSESKYFGPRNELRPTLPKVSTLGCAHGPSDCPAAARETRFVVWNQYPATSGCPERVPALTGPTRPGRQGPVSLGAWQELRPGVNGNPPETVVVPFISQPPMSKSAPLPTLPAHFFPWPQANWST